MNEIMIFKNDMFGAIRCVKIDEDTWFVGKDVAKILGYSNTRDALSKHVDEEDKIPKVAFYDGSQNRKMTVINESGLYSLILSSRLPLAKMFKRWVTSEVLPSIRKNGGYIKNQENLSEAELLANAMVVANNIIKNQKERLKELEPKGVYYDSLVSRNLCTNMRNTAKELGIKERVLINYLVENRFLYRDSKRRLLPYSKYVAMGLFVIKEGLNFVNNHPYIQTFITQRGREYLLNIFNCYFEEV